MKTKNNVKGVYVHEGRGGRSPGGHRTFVCELTYIDFVCRVTGTNGMLIDRDESGRFCKPFWLDGGGNYVANEGDYIFNWDNEYDTDRFIPIGEIDEETARIIREDGQYISPELEEKISEFKI